VEAPEPQRAEVDVPLAIIDLDQAHVFAAEGLAHVTPRAAPANAAVAAHAAHLIVPRVLERRQTAGIGPRGRLVLESGRRISQGIMRPDLVELLAPAAHQVALLSYLNTAALSADWNAFFETLPRGREATLNDLTTGFVANYRRTQVRATGGVARKSAPGRRRRGAETPLRTSGACSTRRP
jgi:hypothetical protein